MSYLIICEKPNVASDVAKALGAAPGKDWHEGDGVIVTWCQGHLLTSAEPEVYNPAWKEWRMSNLPMVPKDFQFQYVPRDSYATFRLRKIAELAKRATTIVNACDAGREGEYIWRLVMEHLRLPINGCLRMWLNTTTKEGILAAWNSKMPATQPRFENLGLAARARSQADWLLGINGTQAVTLAFPKGNSVWSVGRVQTAVLRLVVDRDEHINNFMPEPFYGVYASIQGEQHKIAFDVKLFVPEGMEKLGKFTRLFKNRDEAKRVEDRAFSSHHWKVIDERKEAAVRPPSLFSLVELQKFCCIHLQWPAKRTLEAAQEAYENDKTLTYPRTDAECLPEDYVNEADRVYRILFPRFFRTSILQPCYPAEQGDRKSVFSDKGLTDHFAIVPTGILPPPTVEGQVPRDSVVLWRIVARRFLLAFAPDAIFTELHRLVESEDPEYPDPQLRKISGFYGERPLKTPGWIDYALFLKQDMPSEELDRTPALPEEKDGIVGNVRFYTNRTTRPEPYTEDQLLTSMQGYKLGTSATRASTIETLLARHYIQRRDNVITASEHGIFLISQLRERKVDFISHPETTEAWELQLEQIENGDDKAPSRQEFLASVLEKTIKLIRAMGGAAQELKTQVLCPKTRLPVKETADGFDFPGFPGVKCPKVILQREMSADEYRNILASKEGAGPFEGFVSSKTGNPFKAKLVLDEKKKRFSFVFPKR